MSIWMEYRCISCDLIAWGTSLPKCSEILAPINTLCDSSRHMCTLLAKYMVPVFHILLKSSDDCKLRPRSHLRLPLLSVVAPVCLLCFRHTPASLTVYLLLFIVDQISCTDGSTKTNLRNHTQYWINIDSLVDL